MLLYYWANLLKIIVKHINFISIAHQFWCHILNNLLLNFGVCCIQWRFQSTNSFGSEFTKVVSDVIWYLKLLHKREEVLLHPMNRLVDLSSKVVLAAHYLSSMTLLTISLFEQLWGHRLLRIFYFVRIIDTLSQEDIS